MGALCQWTNITGAPLSPMCLFQMSIERCWPRRTTLIFGTKSRTSPLTVLLCIKEQSLLMQRSANTAFQKNTCHPTRLEEALQSMKLKHNLEKKEKRGICIGKRNQARTLKKKVKK